MLFQDFIWTSKRSKQHLYHLWQLKKFRLSPVILKTFYAGVVESLLNQNITSWSGKTFQMLVQVSLPNLLQLCVILHVTNKISWLLNTIAGCVDRLGCSRAGYNLDRTLIQGLTKPWTAILCSCLWTAAYGQYRVASQANPHGCGLLEESHVGPGFLVTHVWSKFYTERLLDLI